MSDATWTIAQALQHARQSGVDRLDAQIMLSTLLGQSRAWLLAHDQDPVPANTTPQLTAWIERRAQGEPLAYLLGDKEFFGLNLSVSPAVLIPRPDTETLVEWALSLIPQHTPWQVVDLGTGSGAIALAIARHRPHAHVTAVDASETALATAHRNAEKLGLQLSFVGGSWFSGLAGQRFDLIVSNPPYIAEGDAHLAALTHEPISALTSGPDGLDDIRLIVGQARNHLKPGGHLLLEHGYDQAEQVARLMHEAGFIDVATHQDLGGQNRCTGGKTR